MSISYNEQTEIVFKDIFYRIPNILLLMFSYRFFFKGLVNMRGHSSLKHHVPGSNPKPFRNGQKKRLVDQAPESFSGL